MYSEGTWFEYRPGHRQGDSRGLPVPKTVPI